MATRERVPKPLTRMQIDATIERLKSRFGTEISNKSKAIEEQNQAIRLASIRAMLRRGCNDAQIEIMLPQIKYLEIPGIESMNRPHGNYHYRGRLQHEFEEKLQDFKYSLIMADNTSCQSLIDNMEAQIAAMLR